jgi:hypothetical protein
VAHNGFLSKRDFFDGSLWVETNQDAGFSYKKYRTLLETTRCQLKDGFAIAEPRLEVQKVRQVGRGRALALNLSPQRYLQYREEGTDTDAHRAVFLKQINPSGHPPRVVITHNGKRPPKCEATYWSKGGRTFVFIVQNVPVHATTTGGGGGEGLASNAITIDVELPEPHEVVNERTAKSLGKGTKFSFPWSGLEPVLFSFAE